MVVGVMLSSWVVVVIEFWLIMVMKVCRNFVFMSVSCCGRWLGF